MNAPDIILTICIIIFTWLGYKRGFINSIFSLIKWAGVIVTAVLLCFPLAAWIVQYFVIEKQWLGPLSFTLLFTGSLFLISLLFSMVQKIIPENAEYSFVNKITGIIPGFITGVIAAIMLARVFTASIWFDEPEKQKQTFLLSSMVSSSALIDNTINKIFNAPAQHISAANETVYLNPESLFKSDNYKAIPQLEDKLLNLVNTERAKRGLKILVKDEHLYQAAYYHAADMFTRGYFSHNSPEGTDPFERMKKFGIMYISAGENLAHSYDLDEAHTGLMNSPGHKANILNPSFGKAGIAVLQSDTKGLMVVQEFHN